MHLKKQSVWMIAGAWMAAQCQTELVPMDPQGTAEPLRHGWDTSGKTYSRKGKMVPGNEEKVWETALQTPGLEKKEGEEVL